MPSQLCRLVAFATAAVLAPAAFCAQPWDEAFTGAPDAILKGAVAVPSGDAEVVVLLEDHRFAIDSSGRIDSVTRKVYRIVRANAVDEWGSVEQ
ncbi:MAG: hypothetical protein JO061_11820, partial [Acidobacteriaceae bacterium]|nr:hypothetical protein [Acidobacteriaceae bacterium]